MKKKNIFILILFIILFLGLFFVNKNINAKPINYNKWIIDVINNIKIIKPELCKIDNKFIFFSNTEAKLISKNNIIHIKTPKNVKSLYFSANAINNKSKLNNFLNISKEKEINSIMIDLKEVDWYTSFNLDDSYFTDIKPVSNNKIKNINDLITKLHNKWIYIIARIAVFKDKRLAEVRPDLAVKWLKDWTTWTDFKWNKYTDPYSKKVWNYNAELWIAAYELWFDEINYDYVRFPTDWYISGTYYSFWNKILSKNKKWGKVKIIDEFSNYITTKLKKYNSNIVVSADVFWLVTDYTMLWIWQNLESFLLSFDYVWPMIYPSHYWEWHYWYKYPDNVPYNIINIALNNASSKIDNLNLNINDYKTWTWIFKYNDWFVFNKTILDKREISLKNIRPYLQWFSCTWCNNYTLYNRDKFRSAVKWVNDSWIDSWLVWSSGWNYRYNRFNDSK